MNNPKYAKYVTERGEVNPFFLTVYEMVKQSGELDGLSDEEALEKVVVMAEQMNANLLQSNTKDTLHSKYPKLIAASKENSDLHVQKFVKALNKQISKENDQ